MNLYLLSSRALIGICLLFPLSAQAAMVKFEYLTTIGLTSTHPDLLAGQEAKVILTLDNGNAGINTQTWTSSDLLSVTFDFNDGDIVTTFSAPWGGTLAGGNGYFQTDSTGNIISVLTSWFEATSVGSDWVTNSSRTPYAWWLNSGNPNYCEDNFTKCVSFPNPSQITLSNNWTLVTSVPIPSAGYMFVAALLLLVNKKGIKSSEL